MTKYPEYERVRTICIVGCGTIGASWCAWFLARGFHVKAYDVEAGRHEALTKYVSQAWIVLQQIDAGIGEVAGALARLSFHSDLHEALSGSEFVQENLPEKLELKQEVLHQIDQSLPIDVVIASSTSGIRASLLQARMSGAKRLVVGHPFNPPHLIPLVEVVAGAATDAEAAEWALGFYRFVGKIPVHVRKEVDGHLATRLQMALWREAVHLIESGVASVTDVDAAVVHGLGLRWAVIGPALSFHLAGGPSGLAQQLSHFGPSIQRWWDDLGSPRLTGPLEEQLVRGVGQEIGSRSFEQLVAERDRALLEVIRLRYAGAADGSNVPGNTPA
ncbi:MAG: 3-hydroxyacyl-CoA dehydrogenase NAD-binding domain-containing protein [Bradyrhizobium sp.]